MSRRPPQPRVQIQTGTDADDSIIGFFDIPARFSGGAGDDTILGYARGDTLDGGDGDDLIFDGDLRGSPGVADILLGGAGNDTLISSGSLGRSVIDGGDGFDSASVSLTIDSGEAYALDLANVADFIDPIIDPFAQGFVRLVDGAEGAEVQVRAFGDLFPDEPFGTAMILVGIAAADVPETAFLI